jgi:hypothetical protein
MTTPRYTDADRVTIEHDGRFIPATPGNREYDALIASGVVIEPYREPPPSAAEYDDALQGEIARVTQGKRAAITEWAGELSEMDAPPAAEVAVIAAWRQWLVDAIACKSAAHAALIPLDHIVWPADPVGMSTQWLSDLH